MSELGVQAESIIGEISSCSERNIAFFRMGTCFDIRKSEDPTQVIHTFQTTNLVGIVSLLYGTLLHAGGIKDGTEAAILPHHTITMATLAVRLLNHVALLDLEMLQVSCWGQGHWQGQQVILGKSAAGVIVLGMVSNTY